MITIDQNKKKCNKNVLDFYKNKTFLLHFYYIIEKNGNIKYNMFRYQKIKGAENGNICRLYLIRKRLH